MTSRWEYVACTSGSALRCGVCGEYFSDGYRRVTMIATRHGRYRHEIEYLCHACSLQHNIADCEDN